MKIGIDARMIGSSFGGIGRYVFELVKGILSLDSENSYYLFYNEDSREEAEKLKYFKNIFFVKVNIRHYSVAEQVRLPSILNKYNLDLMHFPNFNVPLLYRRPFVVTIHDLVHHKIGGAKKSHYAHFLAYKKIIKNAASKSKIIITVSNFSKTDISKVLSIPSQKIRVTYEGTFLNTHVSPQGIINAKNKYLISNPYFLFVGVLERKKNIINLARGFDELIKKYRPDIDLVIAGRVDKHYPEIKYKALDIQNRKSLIFTDYVEELDLQALYAGAYAFVSASLHEGFGLPGVEAIKFGLPLAVSDIPVFNEIYDNCAIYFNPLDTNDIAEKMNLLIKDKKFYGQLSSNSSKAASLFNWQNTARQTLEVYNEALLYG